MSVVKIPVGESNQPIVTVKDPDKGVESKVNLDAENNDGKEPIKPKEEDIDTNNDVNKDVNKDVEDKGDDTHEDTDPQNIIITKDGVDTTFTLDDKGNAVNDKGEIVYTVDALKELEEDPDNSDDGGKDSSSIEDISKITGINILENNEPKVYENTVEGFAARENDVRQFGFEEGSEKAINTFFSQNPEFKDMYQYKQNHGSIEGFGEHVDYSKIEVNKENAYNYILQAELKKGNSPERAKRIADISNVDETLVEDGKEALSFLKNLQDNSDAASLHEQEVMRENAIREEMNYYGIAVEENGNEKDLNIDNSVYDLIVKKGSVGNITIPENGIAIKKDGAIKTISRKEIFDYISKPTVEIEGEYYTQAEVDEYTRMSDKTNLMQRYIHNLVGEDINSLVTAAKLKDKANAVRRIVIKSNTNRNAASNKNRKVKIPIK